MRNLANNPELRRILQNITEQYIGDIVGEQKQLVARLLNTYKHSISLKIEAVPNNPSTFQYTCHMYSLDLVNSSEVEKIASRYKDIFPSAEFIIFLIQRNILKEKTWDERANGDIIIYFDQDKPVHSGKIYLNKIVSKWGLANLWEHDIFEVPISYGNEVRVFASIQRSLSINAFIEFSKTKESSLIIDKILNTPFSK
ncbi:MAG: hypothetical protein PHC54_06715 [Candidatus Omnitrophica bacterium]|nr:hypothetical protein [Candidatus Omnitrophota bacterium]